MSAREQFESAVRSVATYNADPYGTSGYLLSEEQFAAIVAAADEYRAAALRSLAGELEADSSDRLFTGGDPGTASGLRCAARLARADADGSPS